MGRVAVILIAVVAVVALLIMMILFLASPAAPWISSGHPSAQSHTGGGGSPTSTTTTTSPAAQTSTATTTTTKAPPTAPPPTTTTTTTKAPSAQNLLKLNVTRVIVDSFDPGRYADIIVKNSPVYDLNYVNKLRQSEFVLVEVTLVNTLNRELALEPGSFVLITDKGEYPSVVIDDMFDAFYYLNIEAEFNFNPLFSLGTVVLKPGYVLQHQYLIFMVPKGAVVKGLALVDGGVRLAEVPIDSNMVSYLSVIRSVKLFSNDSRVKVDLTTITPLYTVDKVVKIEGRIYTYDSVRTVAVVGVDVAVNSTLKTLRGQLSKDIPISTFGIGQPVTVSVELPPGGGPWDINITLYFAYYPTWHIKVNSLINDTAEAVKNRHSGYTYLIFGIDAYFNGTGNSVGYISSDNFRLVTNNGVYNVTYTCCLGAVKNALSPGIALGVDSGSVEWFQLIFLVPTSARPLYLLLVDSYGDVVERIPVYNIMPTYYSVVDWIKVESNSSDVSVFLYGPLSLGLLAGQRYNLTISISVWHPEENYTLVGVNVPPPFKLVAIYPNIIGKVLKQNTNIQLEIAGPEGSSYYFNSITITLYFRRGGSGK